MKYKNSFFVIDIQGDGTYLELYPPQSDGKKLEIRQTIENSEPKQFNFNFFSSVVPGLHSIVVSSGFCQRPCFFKAATIFFMPSTGITLGVPPPK